MRTDGGAQYRQGGQVLYRDATGGIVGREWFELCHHAAGHTLRAFCEMDDIGLTRDVTLALDETWRPIDGFCRITERGQVTAATHIAVGQGQASLRGLVRRAGRLEATEAVLATPTPPAYLGLHPLQGDALIVNCVPGLAPGAVAQVPSLTNSHSPDGEQDVGLHGLVISVTFRGHETVDVAAGRFAARRFALQWGPDWPPADLWVREEDCLFLCMRWSMTPRWYELASLDDGRPTI
ncbi:hypothetical protein [Azospirillum sp. B4]|uniref:hypothetical protein n=1 Tax=Azospirillum sp. B4 TaxID=95605 RepID=UPI00034AC8F2|nr:hypothetical protein [Azospirillum sp. B4]